MHLLKACSWWDKSEKWRNKSDELTPRGQKNEKIRNLKNEILSNFWSSPGCPGIVPELFGAQLRKSKYLVTRRAYSCISSRVIRSQVELVGKFWTNRQIDDFSDVFFIFWISNIRFQSEAFRASHLYQMHLLKACGWWDKLDGWRILIVGRGSRGSKMRNLMNHIWSNF